jgi:hypothetical protein
VELSRLITVQQYKLRNVIWSCLQFIAIYCNLLLVSNPPEPNIFHTHNHIFNSVSDLLHRWPNTLRRNGVSDFYSSLSPHSFPALGHSLVPATVPEGTLLYHGRDGSRMPSSPDCLAFDFEHAYLFCRGPEYVVSLQVKRDMQDGPMKSQDVIL